MENIYSVGHVFTVPYQELCNIYQCNAVLPHSLINYKLAQLHTANSVLPDYANG